MRQVALVALVAALLGAGDAPLPRSGRYLILLKDAQTDPAVTARLFAEQAQGRILFVYRHALRGFAIDGISSDAAEALARDERVRWMEPDRPLSLAGGGTQSAPPWGLDRVDQRDLPLDVAYRYDGSGTGVHAYVIDTGIRISHVDFGGRAVYGYDFINNTTTADDGHGHGTHVAGTLGGAGYGVAKDVTVVAVRVLDNSGQGTIAGVIAGVDWVTANAIRPAVANMSLTGNASPTLDQAVQNSIASGVTYCVAAGNGGALVGVFGIPLLGVPQEAGLFSPARVPEALTVGATDIDDSEASFSNYGASVKILAPGVNIQSSWNTSDTASTLLSGTSMATPHVAGAVALFLEANPGATPGQARQAILANGTPNKISGMSSPLTPNLLLHTRGIGTAGGAVPAGNSSSGGGCGLLGLELLPILLLIRRRRSPAA